MTYGIPIAGTMAHSYVEAFPDELDAFLSEIGVAPEQRADVALFVDEDSGPLYSDDGKTSGLEAPFLQLRGYFAAPIKVSEEAARALDALFPCDGSADGRLVACSQPEEAFPSGDLVLIGGLLAGPFPLDDAGHSYTVGGYFGDDEPREPSLPTGEFDLSFLKDTNRWYELWWFPSQEQWTLNVSDVVGQLRMPAQSNERVVIDGSLFAYFVTEGGPLFRVSAIGTDEERSWTNEVSGGDVSGPDAEAPLEPAPSDAVVLEPAPAPGY